MTTHGQTRDGRKPPEYSAWLSMITRCKPGTEYYERAFKAYGAPGVTVCDRWRTFENFLADVGPKPTPQHRLLRVDKSKEHSPANVRWATVTELNRNHSGNRLLTFQGETLTLVEWAERTGLVYWTIRNRLGLGWSVEQALTTPVRVAEPKKEKGPDTRVKHGHTRVGHNSLTHISWLNMRKQCRPGSPTAHRYFDRGITVCERWETSFENFLSDLGERPAKDYTIERIDDDGNYEPGNCRWAQRKSSLTFRGETRSITEWSARTGLTYTTIRNRLKNGWSVEQALTTPPGQKPA